MTEEELKVAPTEIEVATVIAYLNEPATMDLWVRRLTFERDRLRESRSKAKRCEHGEKH